MAVEVRDPKPEPTAAILLDGYAVKTHLNIFVDTIGLGYS